MGGNDRLEQSRIRRVPLAASPLKGTHELRGTGSTIKARATTPSIVVGSPLAGCEHLSRAGNALKLDAHRVGASIPLTLKACRVGLQRHAFLQSTLLSLFQSTRACEDRVSSP